jgi:hypothetical protein
MSYSLPSWILMSLLSMKRERASCHTGMNYSALQKYSSPLVFFIFCYITNCNLNVFLFGFHVMDIHNIVLIGEVK